MFRKIIACAGLLAACCGGRSVEDRIALADLLLSRGRAAEAVTVLSAAAEVAPDREDVVLELAKACRRAGDPDRAVMLLSPRAASSQATRSLLVGTLLAARQFDAAVVAAGGDAALAIEARLARAKDGLVALCGALRTHPGLARRETMLAALAAGRLAEVRWLLSSGAGAFETAEFIPLVEAAEADRDEAARLLGAVPAGDRADLARGEIALLSGRPEDALPALRRAAESTPDPGRRARALELLLAAARAMGDAAASLGAADLAVSLAPGDPSALYRRAVLRIERDDDAGARADAAALPAGSPAAEAVAGLLALKAGESGRAAELLSRAAGDDPVLNLWLSLALDRSGQPGLARTAAARAAAADPAFYPARLARAALCLADGCFEEAAREAEAALALRPDRDAARFILARAALSSAAHPGAGKSEKSAALARATAGLNGARGASAGSTGEAAAESLARGARSADLLVLLALARARADDADGARSALREALAHLDTAWPELAARPDAALLRAEAQWPLGQPGEAAEALRDADPKDARTVFAQALLADRAGREEEAVRGYEEALARGIAGPKVRDNTCGSNAVGWGWSGHDFDDLLCSDQARFRLTDGCGNVVYDFRLDYLSRSGWCNPDSESPGATGGDGRMYVGSPGSLPDFGTSLDHDFNTLGYVLTRDSPATDSDFTENPSYPGRVFVSTYEVLLSGSLFTNGFGGVTVPSVHNSPAGSTGTLCIGEPLPVIPEPSTLLLLGGGAGLLALSRRLRRKAPPAAP